MNPILNFFLQVFLCGSLYSLQFEKVLSLQQIQNFNQTRVQPNIPNEKYNFSRIYFNQQVRTIRSKYTSKPFIASKLYQTIKFLTQEVYSNEDDNQTSKTGYPHDSRLTGIDEIAIEYTNDSDSTQVNETTIGYPHDSRFTGIDEIAIEYTNNSNSTQVNDTTTEYPGFSDTFIEAIANANSTTSQRSQDPLETTTSRSAAILGPKSSYSKAKSSSNSASSQPGLADLAIKPKSSCKPENARKPCTTRLSKNWGKSPGPGGQILGEKTINCCYFADIRDCIADKAGPGCDHDTIDQAFNDLLVNDPEKKVQYVTLNCTSALQNSSSFKCILVLKYLIIFGIIIFLIIVTIVGILYAVCRK